MPIPFRADSRRERAVYESGPLGPWQGSVAVTPLNLRSRVEFEVCASWIGPPAIGAPDDPEPGTRFDVYLAPEHELARAIALDATAELRRGEVPDLRGSAARLRARRAAGGYG